MLEWRLHYAARGWFSFPAPATGEKKSLKSRDTPGCFYRWGATNNADQICHDARRYPDFNIGLPTGYDSGFFVIETDTAEGHAVDGAASLQALTVVHGPLPQTLMAKSPSGSLHYYFKCPSLPYDHYIKTQAGILPGIDVRGEGGMVLAPPSNRPNKGRYAWVNALPIADPPQWLLDLVVAEKPQQTADDETHGPVHPALVAAAVAAIPNDASVGWDQWNKIGMAIWAATDGSDAGFKIFDDWSQRWSGYDATDTETRWQAYQHSPPQAIGVGTLFYLATQAEPTWQAAYDAQVEAAMFAANSAEAEEPRQEEPRQQESPQQDQQAPNQNQNTTQSPIPLHWHGEQWSMDEQWTVRGLVPETGVGLMPGQWGTIKTFVGLDLAACIMTGQNFAGHKVMRKGGVLFIAAEGSSQIKKRLAALVEHKLNLEEGTTLPFVWIDKCPRLLTTNAPEILIATAKAVADELKSRFNVPLIMIIVDTMAAAAGFADEDDAAQGQIVMNALNIVSKATGTVVMAIDHFGKDMDRGTRGTSTKEGSADFVLALLGARDLSGAMKNIRMAVRKQRNGTVGYEIPCQLKIVTLGTDRDGEAVTSGVVEWLEQSEAPATMDERRQPQSEIDFERALASALQRHGEPIEHHGQTISAVQRGHLLAAFKEIYRGKPTGADMAFGRAVHGAGDKITVFTRDGMQYLAFTETPM